MNTSSPELRSPDAANQADEPGFDSPASAAAREVASREAARIGEMAREWWQRNARTALDLAGTVKDEAAAAGDRTRHYVRDEPLRSVLLAAAAGALITGLMVLLGRRSH